MSDQNSLILPFASLGMPMDPSGSMSMGDDGETVSTTFFDVGARGGTDFAAALDRILAAEDFPGKGFDRYQIVITDGEPGLIMQEPHGNVLGALIAALKPGESLLCLDYSGAQPPFPGEDAPRVIASRALDDREHGDCESLRSVLEGMERPDGVMCGSEFLAIAGIGLAPVPSVAELVDRCRAAADSATPASAGTVVPDAVDKCCGCGGCDKGKS